MVCLFSVLIPFFQVNPTNRSPPTPNHPQSRSIPQRCAATVWWPRHFQLVLSLPAVPAAPAPSSAGYLQDKVEGKSMFCVK